MQIVTKKYHSAEMVDIYNLLYCLGLNASSCSFFHTSYAIWLALEQPERLQLVTKWVYPEVAKEYDTTWRAVERSIRRATIRSWQASPDYLRKLAYGHLHNRPAPAEYLAILAAHLTKESAANLQM